MTLLKLQKNNHIDITGVPEYVKDICMWTLQNEPSYLIYKLLRNSYTYTKDY